MKGLHLLYQYYSERKFPSFPFNNLKRFLFFDVYRNIDVVDDSNGRGNRGAKIIDVKIW